MFVSSWQYCLSGQDGWKSRNIFRKINWRWTCSQIFRKFSHWENLNLNDVKYRICSSLELEYRLLSNNIYTRKGSQTNIYLRNVNNRSTKKKCENYLKLIIKTLERLSTFFSVNFGHNSVPFLMFCCWVWTTKCLLGPTLSIYKCWKNILLQLLTDLQKS